MSNQEAYVGTKIHIPKFAITYGTEARKYPDHCKVALEAFVDGNWQGQAWEVANEEILRARRPDRYVQARYTMIDGIVMVVGAKLADYGTGPMVAVEAIVSTVIDTEKAPRPFDTRSAPTAHFDSRALVRSER